MNDRQRKHEAYDRAARELDALGVALSAARQVIGTEPLNPEPLRYLLASMRKADTLLGGFLAIAEAPEPAPEQPAPAMLKAVVDWIAARCERKDSRHQIGMEQLLEDFRAFTGQACERETFENMLVAAGFTVHITPNGYSSVAGLWLQPAPVAAAV